MMGFVLVIMLFLLGVIVIFSCMFTVRQQTAVIIERFGKYSRVVYAGFQFKLPFIERIAAKVSLRVEQIDIDVETKTRDNVFVVVRASTQFRVDTKKVVEAYYELSNPRQQILSYMEDAIRSALPTLVLDDAFEKKEDIAHVVQETIGVGMSQFGFIIIKTLITSIEPALNVKEAMNSINAAQRQRIAAQELADADKIRIVTKAQAEAEQARLQGEGLANQRKAIVDGLSQSFKELSDSGLSETQIMSVLMVNQYLDTMNKFGENKNSAIFMPASPSGVEDIRAELLQALLANKVVSRADSSRDSLEDTKNQ